MKNKLLISVLLLSILFQFSCNRKMKIDTSCNEYIFYNQNDSTELYISIDSIFEYNIYGKLYKIGDELMMNPSPFSAEAHRKTFEVQLNENEQITLKMRKGLIKDNYSGWYNLPNDSKKRKYVLSPYQKPDFKEFNTDRYRKEIFEVKKIEDVIYAKVKGYWDSEPDDTIDVGDVIKKGVFKALKRRDLELKMDFYLPEGDTLKKRPLMMFIHGGAFFIGDKATEPYLKWCSHFASLGYVCVSINYRLGFKVSANAIERTAYESTQDAHAAMRYLLSKSDVYGIDRDELFVGGCSAGSITALNLAFMRNENRPKSSYKLTMGPDLGDIETSGNDLKADFEFRAVANMWGTVYDLEMLKNTKTAIVSFHGDADPVLPYGYDYPFKAIGEFNKVLFNKMYGSSYINREAKKLGIRSQLYTFPGRGHALHLDENRHLNKDFYDIQNKIVSFFYDEIISHPVDIKQDTTDLQLFYINMTDVEEIYWKVNSGVVINEDKGKIKAAWFSDKDDCKLIVSGYYKNGAGFYKELNIK